MDHAKRCAVALLIAAGCLVACDGDDDRGGDLPDAGIPSDARDAVSDASLEESAVPDVATDGADASLPPPDGDASVDTGASDRRDASDVAEDRGDARDETRVDASDDAPSADAMSDVSVADVQGADTLDARGDTERADARDGSDAVDDRPTCIGQVVVPPPAAMNYLILFDRSSSMSEYIDGVGPPSRWQVVTNAVLEFLQLAEVQRNSVGLQWFEVIDAGTSMTSCTPADYASPEVDMGPLADAAQFPALQGSIQSQTPAGLTPMGPALQGALDHAKQYALANPGRPTMVVMITDGIPTQCTPLSSIDIASNVVGPAFTGTPPIRTAVIGVATGLSALSAIGAAGGGGTQLVSSSATTAADTKQALARLAHSHFTCALPLPMTDAGTSADPAFLNVVVTPSSGPQQTLPLFSAASGCGDGWFFDNPAQPTSIQLCPSICSNIVLNSSAVVVVGCPTPPPQ